MNRLGFPLTSIALGTLLLSTGCYLEGEEGLEDQFAEIVGGEGHDNRPRSRRSDSAWWIV